MTGPGPLTWVVGSGGLLGKQVAAALDGRCPVLVAPPVPWGDRASTQDVLRATARRLAAEAGDGGWQVLWCAGAGVTGTSRDVLRVELEALASLLDALRGVGSSGGSFFFSSSVGGVYAGSPRPPYDERSPVRPLSDYGRAKLRGEELVDSWARQGGGRALIGRIANLYGPGQNLDKPQGLVSQICAAHLRRSPVSIWVSLDTLRDYIYVADAARLILDGMDRLRADASVGSSNGAVVKILGSLRPVTVGAVLGELRRVLKARPNVTLAASPVSAAQARDLSTRSVVWPDLDARAMTPFPAGVHATLSDLRSRQARASTDLHRPTAGGSAS